MRRRPPRPTRTVPLFPTTTLFRSAARDPYRRHVILGQGRSYPRQIAMSCAALVHLIEKAVVEWHDRIPRCIGGLEAALGESLCVGDGVLDRHLVEIADQRRQDRKSTRLNSSH